MRWLFLLLLLIGKAYAASCTAGTDCYCDKVTDPGHALYDANLLLCEDWEAPTLRSRDSTYEDDGAPYYGPWHDEHGGVTTCNRGFNSYFVQTYGEFPQGYSIANAVPISPTLGCSCDNGGGDCVGASVWDATDAFGTNSDVGGIAILAAGEFNDEVAGNGDPSGAVGGGSGQFDGSGSVYWRVKPGETMGIGGRYTFSEGRQSEIGITTFMAWPANLGTSKILNASWKFHEFGPTDDCAFLCSPFSDGWSETAFPFQSLFFLRTVTEATCNSRRTAANTDTGDFSCTTDAFYMEANTAQYTRSVNWPVETWGCARAHFTGLGTTNTSVQMWFQGSEGAAPIEVINLSGFDTTDMGPDNGGDGYTDYALNHYSNYQESNSDGEVSGRYEDNIHITAGTPVTCDSIWEHDVAATPAPKSSFVGQRKVGFLISFVALAALIGAGLIMGRPAHAH